MLFTPNIHRLNDSHREKKKSKMGFDIRIDSYYSNGNLFLRGRLLSVKRSLWREIHRQPGVVSSSSSSFPPPPHPSAAVLLLLFFFFFAAALQQEERPDYVGIKKKRLDPLAFQQAPNQKRGARRLLSIQRLALLHVWSSLISRAASWPGSHLIHASVFISLSFLAMKKKKDAHMFVFLLPPPPPKKLLIE